jgi:hypothetical protein
MRSITAGLANKNGYGIQNSANTNEEHYSVLWYTGDAISGTVSITDTVIMPNDSIATIRFNCSGIKTDGSEGISKVMIASFRKDGAANAIQIGATTNVHSVEDSVNTPTITVAMSGTNMQVTYNSGSGDTYAWIVWADISIVTV